MPKIKKSYGLICCRPSKEGTQFLLIQKATTYHFCEFVLGHYKKHNETHLLRLFNNMTHHEKMDILTMQFSNMWYRIYMNNPEKSFSVDKRSHWMTSYYKKKNKFEATFLKDGGEKLKRLVTNSNNCETPWEFPKGRKKHESEPSIETAIREFTEETGIDDTRYRILWRIKPYIETYNDFGTVYQNCYWFAEAVSEWDPTFKFYHRRQINEVSSIKWVSRINLKYINLESHTYDRLIKCFNKIVKVYKKHTHKPVSYTPTVQLYMNAINSISKVRRINTSYITKKNEKMKKSKGDK